DEPSSPVSGIIGQTQTICFGANNGTATVNPSGGVPPYDILWSNGDQTETVSGLVAGDYTVTVTDANGCEAIQGVTINEQLELSLELSQMPASCHNGNDGTAQIDLILYGLTPADVNDFAIDWSGSTQSTPVATGLIGGQTYSVTITDALGCTAENSITIGNPAEIGSMVVNTVDVSCFAGSDGQATVAGDGGTAPYSYLWSQNAGGQTTATAIDLPAENFTVTITDANGCSTSISVTLSQPEPLRVEYENEDVLCFDEPTGTSLAQAFGGTGPYEYQWATGVSGPQAGDLSPGYTQITVTDSRGCTIVDSTFIRQPDMPLGADFEVRDVSCNGFGDGAIIIYPEGGTPAYTYSLDGKEFKGSSTLLALKSGFYNVFVRDGNGCVYETGEIYVAEPDPLLLDLGPDTTIQYGTDLQFFPQIENADPATLAYFWRGNHQAYAIDDSTAQNPIVTVESQTSFTLTITDPNGCRAEDRITVFVEKDRLVVVPTGFTPNGDGRNDRLLVHGKSDIVANVSRFQVFDRWGEMVFQAENFDLNDPNTGWDGLFK
ncbi:MAG: hypothetical protein D6714_20055, partial [Bacteroidetes bacterium]